MPHIYLVPQWFFGYDSILELAFAIVTLLVGVYAFKIYKISGQRQLRLFGTAFMSFSLAYFVISYLNFCVISELKGDLCELAESSNLSFLNSICKNCCCKNCCLTSV